MTILTEHHKQALPVVTAVRGQNQVVDICVFFFTFYNTLFDIYVLQKIRNK